jgi:AraC-like DNA-binding protein
MFPYLQERQSDSPLVKRIWTTKSERADSFTSISTVSWSMVIARCRGRNSISFHGPETGATRKDFPPDAEWFGIEFKPGTFMPTILPSTLIDKCIVFPIPSSSSFTLFYSKWQMPSFENADNFIDRLVRKSILEHEPITNISNQRQTKSVRTIQYRFLRSTGLSKRTIQQIERARYATTLLKEGVSILDTVYEAGYSDQPHLTRSLKRFIGYTPAEIKSTLIIGL